MKKFIALTLGVVMALSLAACTGVDTRSDSPEQPEQTAVQIPNPVINVENAAAFDALGITMDAPDNASDVIYNIIDNRVADVKFTLGGKEYNYRASKTDSDIAGVYDSFTPAFDIALTSDEGELAAAAEKGADGGTLVKWSAGGVNYTLYTASDADEAAVRAAVAGVMAKTFTNVAEAAGAEKTVIEFKENEAAVIDLNGDGINETVTFEVIPEQDYNLAQTKVIITSDNGVSAEFITSMQYLGTGFAYDVDGDGLVEMFVSGDECSCDYSTWAFRFDGEKIINASYLYDPQEGYDVTPPSCSGSIIAIDPATGYVTIDNTVDIIGSWGCQTQYEITSDFAMKQVDGALWSHCADAASVDPDYWTYCMLNTTKELPYVPAGSTETAMLPVGESLSLIDTDGATFFHFVTKSGIEGTINVEFSTVDTYWGYYINGEEEGNFFESIPYAG